MVSKPQIPEATVCSSVWRPTFWVAGAWGTPCKAAPGFARPALAMSECRQLCPQLPARLVLPAQLLPQWEEAAGRRGGMANHAWGRARNTGSSSSHPRLRTRLITEREQPKTSSWGAAGEPAQVPSICSPSATLHHHHLPGEDQWGPRGKTEMKKGGHGGVSSSRL